MEQIIVRLEGLVGRIAGGGGGGDGPPIAVSEYDSFYTGSVQPFIDACNSWEPTKKLGKTTETAFKHARNVIEASTQCKKPDDAGMMAFLGPVVEVITNAQAEDRKSPAYNQEKAYGEAIQCLNFLLSDGPKGVIMAQLDASDFYLSKTLSATKDKEDPEKSASRAFVKTLKEMLTKLGEYCNEFHKTGIMWKFSGGDLKEFKPGQKAAGSGGAASPESRLENLCGALEAYIAKTQGGGEDGPVCVTAYAELYKSAIQPFIDASGKVSQKKIADNTEKAMKHLGSVVKATTECKNPGDAFMTFLGPIVEVITGSMDPDRKSPDFNHLMAFSEAIQALNFVCMPGAPKGYIMGQIDAGAMYTNKILTTAKDAQDPEKTNQRAFVTSLKAMLTALADYANEHFKMGLQWKPNGIDIKDFKP